MATTIIVQARMGSTRLPGKAMLPIGGESIVERIARRLARCRNLDDCHISFAIPEGDENRPIGRAVHMVSTCAGSEREDLHVVAANEQDVLGRVYDTAARSVNADVVVRLTADCPLVDPLMVFAMIDAFGNRTGQDYLSNCHPERTVPQGYDVEVFSFDALREAHFRARGRSEREHVTPWMYDPLLGGLRCATWTPPSGVWDWTDNLSVDTREDYERVKAICEAVGPNAGMEEVRAWLERR